MKIIAIDPGSKVAGYAVFNDNKLIDAGLLKPYKTRLPNDARILSICFEVEKLLDEHKPKVVVLEWTTGKVGRNRHKGGGSGLAIYGIAIGAIWIVARLRDGVALPETVLIDESWTKGVKKKKRLEDLELTCPAYKRKLDPGGDMGDAICLGEYYLKECRILGV